MLRPALRAIAAPVSRATLALAAVAALAACSTRNPYANDIWYYNPEPGSTLVPRVQSGPRNLAMFRGDTGMPLDWYGISVGIRWADIVIIGEQHDDEVAHGVQEAVVAETLAAWPGSAVSMEMLERDEQPIVDAYLAGSITEDEFVDRTGSRDWASTGTWHLYYQPVVDAARHAHAPVIAANAPREYVRRARTEGYAALEQLPADERALFSVPLRDPPASYRARFKALMSGDGAHAVDEAKVDEILLSQRLWDATMADSVVRALDAAPYGGKVVHLVGQFHSEHDGGLVSEIQARAPFAKVLTITVQRGEAFALRSEDTDKADVVVYGMRTPPAWRNFQAGPDPDAVQGPVPEQPLPTWGFAY
jgi:uncharacterized iron-regulated protein